MGLLTLGLGVALWTKQPPNPAENISPPSPSPTVFPTPNLVKTDQIIDFEKDGLAYRAAWVKTSDFKNLSLHPNFKEKLSAKELFSQKKCRSLVSGGFYTKEGDPVGLFVSEGEKLKGSVKSLLFDGFFSIDESGKAQISFLGPTENVRLALQSGPVLIKDGEVLKLKISEDKSARRVVLAISKGNEAFFFIVFNKDSILEGPLLADLPKIVKSLEEKTNSGFTEAINLDGGSASAFYSDFLTLAEFSSIGSFFCLGS